MDDNFQKNIINDQPIGFFDSGVGGLTVLDKVKNILPNEKFIYFGDTLNMPYGEKSSDQLIEFAKRIFDFYESKSVKAVVMACNTTSAIVYEKLKNEYSFKIYPIIQSVSKVIASMQLDSIGIFATPATINSHCYSRELNKYSNARVIEISCPKWVKLVENSLITTEECKLALKEKLDEMMQYNPQKIVLGCTHYPYLKDELSKLLPNMEFIDPAIYFAEFIKDDLSINGLLSNSNKIYPPEFYVSSDPDKFKIVGNMFYDFKDSKVSLVKFSV